MKCDDGLQCIAVDRVCDNKAQCHDGSDESKCGGLQKLFVWTAHILAKTFPDAHNSDC